MTSFFFFQIYDFIFSKHAIRLRGHTLSPCALGSQHSKRELDDERTCEGLAVERRNTFHSQRKFWPQTMTACSLRLLKEPTERRLAIQCFIIVSITSYKHL